jgi:anti-sigma factor RsiW
MPTIHDQIDEVLAAAVHDELSDEERRALHVHLVECAECRALHKEEQLMHRALGEVFGDEKPDFGFEKRMLYAFRHKAPQRTSFGVFLSNLLRSRGTQIIGAAALLLALLQMGRFLTGEDMSAPFVREARTGSAAIAANSNQISAATDAVTNGPEQYAKGQTDGDVESGQKLQNPRVGDFFDRSNQPGKAARGSSVSGLATSRVAAVAASAPSPEAKPELNKEGSVSGAVLRETSDSRQTAEEVAAEPAAAPGSAQSSNLRKLIRNARVDLEVRSFDEALQQIAAFANEDRGYIATSNSEKQENGKLRGEVVVKMLPENLDTFLNKLHEIGDLKNQTLGSEDVTKQYFDTDARLKNAQAMEQRLLEILKKKSDDINDLLAVEKELGRVREQIEQMQGELKLMDSQVQFATVTIALAEKDMDVPAAFLLKERAQLALYAGDVEKVYTEVKALASPKIQITNATLDRDNSGRVFARVSMLVAPEESDSVIAKVKGMGRVDKFQVQTERVARGGQGMAEDAKTERDKVQLNITISREEQEAALQQTNLRVRASDVTERAKQLRNLAEKQGGRVRASSFARDPNGREFANVSLRVPMKNYTALMQSLGTLGKLENVSVHRDERPDAQLDEANAPADVSIQVYSQGRIVSEDKGLFPTLRRTLAAGAGALMWSVQMIGVALAFLAPWLLPVALVIWLIRLIARNRAAKRAR